MGCGGVESYYTDALAVLWHGDCLEAMATMEPDSVDAIVTDPPYSLSFMSRDWDSQGQRREIQEFNRRWAEAALRVLKPGGHMLVAGIGRTHHRMMAGVEDAGFEVRDCIYHVFGSGFPKNHSLSVAFDKMAGMAARGIGFTVAGYTESATVPGGAHGPHEAISEAAKRWDGWGTALKPAVEVWALFRKPLSERTIARNVLRWGTGAINVDGCRVQSTVLQSERRHSNAGVSTGPVNFGLTANRSPKFDGERHNPAGRWPPNFVMTHSAGCRRTGSKRVRSNKRDSDGHEPSQPSIWNVHAIKKQDGVITDADGLETVAAWECVEGCPVLALTEQAGIKTSGKGPIARRASGKNWSGGWSGTESQEVYGDSGSPARFFPQFAWQPADFWPFRYVAKAARAERDRGLAGAQAAIVDDGRSKKIDNPYLRGKTVRTNRHPTVKPVALMKWLITLVLPPGGVVLDPFAGSGTTLVAAKELGFKSIGIELMNEPETEPYCEIAKLRLIATQGGLTL